jgi:protein O-mannosyl-transferase
MTLLPVLGIIQVGEQMMADRYAYLPSLGPFLLVAIGTVSAYDKLIAIRQKTNAVKMLFISLGTAVTIIFSILTIKQIHIWKNGITLWTAEIEAFSRKNPNDFQNPAQVYVLRGVAFFRQGKLEEALKDYSKAIELDPGNWKPWGARGLMHIKLGKFREALRDHNQAILMKPDSAELYYNRGNIYVALKQFRNAISDYTQAIKFSDVVHPEYHHNRGLTYERLGMLEAAGMDLSKAEIMKKE